METIKTLSEIYEDQKRKSEESFGRLFLPSFIGFIVLFVLCLK